MIKYDQDSTVTLLTFQVVKRFGRNIVVSNPQL